MKEKNWKVKARTKEKKKEKLQQNHWLKKKT